MSDDHQTPTPDEPKAPLGRLADEIGERVEHAVHGMGEGVERVEHAVEHAAEEIAEHLPAPVRRPVRWTLHKLVLLVGLSLVGLVVLVAVGGGIYIWNNTQLAAHALTARVNRVLEERSDLSLTLAGLEGNPLSTVRVREPRLRFGGPGGPILLEAHAMQLRYSTWGLLTARHPAIVVELDHPVVHLRRDAAGRLVLPHWSAGPSRPGGRPRGMEFIVSIRDGRLVAPEPELSIEGLDLDAEAATDPVRVDISALSWDRGFYGLALERFSGEVTVGDSVRVRVRALESDVLALRGDAAWGREGRERVVRAHVERVQWAWLAKVFRNKSLDVPGEGQVDVEATGAAHWVGKANARAVWSDLPVEGQGEFAWRDGRLVLAPLRGTSPAGTLDGRLLWSKGGWEVAGRATAADPSRMGAIGLAGWPAGKIDGQFSYRVDTRTRGAASSRFTARTGPSRLAGWDTDSATVLVEVPARAHTRFEVRARRRGGAFDLDGVSTAAGWEGDYAVHDFPLDEWPDGRATGLRGRLGEGRGRVSGAGGELRVDGVLEGTQTDWFGAHAARWRLEAVSGRMLPTPDLTAALRLEDAMTLGIHFDSVTTHIRLGDRTLDFADLRARAGDSLVTMDGRADWDSTGWRMSAPQAGFSSPDFDWRVEPPLELAGDPRGVDFRRLVAHDGDATFEADGRWASPGGHYAFEARATELQMSRLGLPHDLALKGRARARLRVEGVSGDPRWSFDATVSRPGATGHTADSLTLDLGGSPGRLEVRDGTLRIAGGVLEARGEIEVMSPAWPDTLTPTGVSQWIATATRWNGSVVATELPLEGLGDLLPAARGWKGLTRGRIDVAGRPSSPRLEARGEARPLSFRSFRIDGATVEASLSDDRLRVRELKMTRDDVVSTATGEMPLVLAVGRAPALPDEPMAWRLRIPNGDLGVLPLLVPQVGGAAGRFAVDLQVSGTPRAPNLEGEASIRDGRLRPAGREELLENVTANLRFERDRIVLDTLTARQRTGEREVGRVTAGGDIRLAGMGIGSYLFRVRVMDFTALETGGYAARFDGDFVVTEGPRVKGQILPYVRGDVELQRAVILYDFTKQTEAEQVAASTQPLAWTYQIQVRATDHLRWQPPDADIEFSADLEIQQTPDSLLMFGDLVALRGSYYFLSNRFNVERAELTFDNVKGLNPLVDAEATTRLVPVFVSAGDTETPPEHVIRVTITGRADEPEIHFTSEPDDLDEAQILREITVGGFRDPSGGVALSGATDPLDSYLTRQINRQLSAELSRVFKGYISEWELSRQTGGLLSGQGDVVVGVGSQVNRNLAVRYRQRLPGTTRNVVSSDTDLFERNLEAEYRLSRFFSVTSELIQRRSTGTSSSTATPDFNVNLKARWEY